MKIKIILFLLAIFPAVTSGQPERRGVHSLVQRLESLGRGMNGSDIKFFLDSLSGAGRCPFVTADSVLLILEGTDSTQHVAWAGDFNGWDANSSSGRGNRLSNTNLWICRLALPEDARIDYKVVVDGHWILDPRNTRVQYSGWGPNSVIQMPGYVVPPELSPLPGRKRGKFAAYSIRAASMPADYRVAFRVYQPAGCEAIQHLPVCYVLDGQEYADSLKGAMTVVIDYLVAKRMVRPLLVVFIDPRQPDHPENNRRMSEYAGNGSYVDFLADELVHFVDSVFHTDPKPGSRAIMGTSMGGWQAAYAGLQRSDCFGNLVVHSPAFDSAMVQMYGVAPLLNLKVFLSTGVFFDTRDRASLFYNTLVDKGYTVRYREVNQGHSWGNWRGLIAEPLSWMFPQGVVSPAE